MRGITGQQSDQELIERFRTGNDMRAFDALAMRYKDMVFNLCYRLMGDYDEAHDCAQEAFIKAYRGLPAFRGEARFSTWLYRIAVNTCRDSIDRRGSRRATVDPDRSRSPMSSPDELALKNDTERAVQGAISALPEELRVLVVLRDIEGKSYEDIEEITGMKEGTVKSRLSRARHRLRDSLRGVVEHGMP